MVVEEESKTSNPVIGMCQSCGKVFQIPYGIDLNTLGKCPHCGAFIKLAKAKRKFVDFMSSDTVKYMSREGLKVYMDKLKSSTKVVQKQYKSNVKSNVKK